MREIGKDYELIAENFLKKKGYKIIDKNFTTKMGEIDIIANKNNTLIFIEVKARKNANYMPYEAVNKSKQLKIIKSSIAYIKSKNIKDTNIRYDIVSIKGDRENPEIELIENAFQVEKYF